jgi:hypothetical protein
MNKILECSNDDPRKDIRGILQPKGNDIIRKQTPLSTKNGFMVILFSDHNLIVT